MKEHVRPAWCLDFPIFIISRNELHERMYSTCTMYILVNRIMYNFSEVMKRLLIFTSLVVGSFG
jgi:hypothetical protein